MASQIQLKTISRLSAKGWKSLGSLPGNTRIGGPAYMYDPEANTLYRVYASGRVMRLDDVEEVTANV